MDEAPTTPAAEHGRRISQTRLAIVGATVSAVLIVGALGTYWLLTRESATAGGHEAGTSTQSSTPTPTVSVAPVASGVELNRDFKSPSGNLRCSLGQFSGQPAAICQQIEINYAVPAGACPGGERGVFVGVNSTGAYWPCVQAWGEPAEVIAFDTPVTHSGITCSVNFVTGVTCTNEDGHGFTMEYDAGVTQF